MKSVTKPTPFLTGQHGRWSYTVYVLCPPAELYKRGAQWLREAERNAERQRAA